MWNKAAASPALATTSDPGTLRPNAGVIGVPTTHVLFGGENDDVGVLTGGRFTLGYRFKPCEDTGVEVTYMFLGDKSLDFSANNNTTPIIARPFFNVQTSAQDSLVIALPTDQQTGNINIRVSDNSIRSTRCGGRRSSCPAAGRWTFWRATGTPISANS